LNKLKLNYTSISFLPILVCIPLGYQLITNLHFGGLNLFQEFLISAFNPKIDNEIIITVINRLNETILIGFFSWLVSIIFGAIFGVLHFIWLSKTIFFKQLILLIILIILLLFRINFNKSRSKI